MEYELYKIEGQGEIVPLRKTSQQCGHWEGTNLDDVLSRLLPTCLSLAGLDVGLSKRREFASREIIRRLQAMYILDAETGFSLLTGVFPSSAAFRFKFEGKEFFTIRPDFCHLIIAKNFFVSPLNIVEKKIKAALFANYQLEIKSIYLAIESDLLPQTITEWIEFFQLRGVDISHLELREKIFNEGRRTGQVASTDFATPTINKLPNSSNEQSKKSGKPKGALTEAVEFVYKKFLNEGNTEILRPGKIKEFLARLKELSNDNGNGENSEYIAERIKEVKKNYGPWVVITQEREIKISQGRTTIEKSQKYTQEKVSKRLTQLRKKFPYTS